MKDRNVGFLRYWTPGNIPLFLLATPVLYLLIKSGLQYIREPLSVTTEKPTPANSPQLTVLIRAMALSQLILAILAIQSVIREVGAIVAIEMGLGLVAGHAPVGRLKTLKILGNKQK